jgi:hypothetical protein
MADSVKSISQEIEDQEAIIKSDMMPEKVKAKAATIKEDLERKLKALKIAAERGSEKVKKAANEVIDEIEGKGKAPSKVSSKKSTKKQPAKPKPSPISKFELVIDGKTYKFDDLKSKEQCEQAVKAVKARRDEQIKNQKARVEGAEKARTIPVTRRISDGFVSIAKKAVSQVSPTRIDKHPTEIKKELDAVEKAFTNLFDKLEDLMGKKIPQAHRKEIMAILNSFESKVDKGVDKKSKAVTKKKEDGGIVDVDLADDSWSYTSFLQ